MTIISFTHNFIFLKNVKTAGTSIEVDLSPLAGEDAVVTPIIPPENGHQPRNFTDPQNGTMLFRNHMSAQDIRRLIGPERFNAMYRFCVERDPIDKAISQFHMLRNSPVHNADQSYQKDFETFCQDGDFPVDLWRYSERIDGTHRLLVNRVLRYDRLAQELSDVMTNLGLTTFKLQARAKSSYARKTLIRRDEVTATQRQIILEAYAPTRAATGMTWPDLDWDLT